MQTTLDDQTGRTFDPPAPANGARARSPDRVEDALSAVAAGALVVLLFALIPMLWTAAAWSSGMRPQAPAIVLATSLTWTAIGAGLAYAAGRFDKSAQLAAFAALAIAAVLVSPARPAALMGSPAAASSPLALAFAVTQTAGIPLAALAAALWMLTTLRHNLSRWSVASGVLALPAVPLVLEPTAALATQAHIWTVAFAIAAIVTTALTARRLHDPAAGSEGSLGRRTATLLLVHTAVPATALVTIMTELAGPLTPLSLPASGLVALTIGTALLPIRLGTGQAVALPLPSPSFLALIALVLAVLVFPDGSHYRLLAAIAALCIGTAVHLRQVLRIVRSTTDLAPLIAVMGLALGTLIGVGLDLSRLLPPLAFALILLVLTSPSITASVRSSYRPIGVLLLSLAAAFVVPMASSSLGGAGRIALALALIAAAIPVVRCTQDWPERNLIAAAFLLTLAALFPSATRTVHAECGAWATFRIVEGPTPAEFRLVSASSMIARSSVAEPAPLARLIAAVRYQKRNDAAFDGSSETPLLVGIVGIEGGATCATSPADVIRYFAVDAVTARLATDTRWFPNYARCTPTARIVIGDPRKTLAAEPDDAFDVLVLDGAAFPSPAFHLLDATQLSVLMAKIAPSGMLVVRQRTGPVSMTPSLSRHLANTPGLRSATVGGDLVVLTRSAPVATAIAAWPDANGIEPRTSTAPTHVIDLPAALRHLRSLPR